MFMGKRSVNMTFEMFLKSTTQLTFKSPYKSVYLYFTFENDKDELRFIGDIQLMEESPLTFHMSLLYIFTPRRSKMFV